MVKAITTIALSIAIVALITGQSSADFVNGGFESGSFAGWVTQDLTGPFYPLTIATAGSDNSFGWPWPSTPTEGLFAAYHGFDGDGATGGVSTIRIAQDLFVDGTTLEFDYRHAWDLTFGGFVDRTFDVNVEVFGGGANLQNTNILTAMQGTTVLDTGPLSGVVDVSAFVGQNVRISFDWSVPEDFSGPAAAQLDNVRLTGVIPEPGSLSLLCLSAFFVIGRRRR